MDKTFVSREEVSISYPGSRFIDVAVLLLTSPFLLAASLFPRPATAVALLLLFAPYAARLLRGEQLSRPTAANLPIIVLALVFLPVSLLVSPAPWAFTWPRVATLAWSIALFFAVVNWPPSLGRGRSLRTRFNGPTRVYLLTGLAVAFVGLMGMRSVDKLFFLPQTGFLADALGFQKGLATNEVAGMLTLFIPFASALAFGCLLTGRRRQLLMLLPLVLVMSATLLLTQSRTGLAATGLGALLALAAAGRINWKWAAVGLALIGTALLLITLTPLLDWFVYAGANSWESVIGPRLGIWGQAADAIRDHPLWGMGFGLFGSLVGLVYPLISAEAAPVLEDAHNLYMQTALDFGLAGLLLFLVVAAVVAGSVVRLTRARPPRTLSRLWAAGLLGSLVAHALYSLTDAVALGTLAGVPLWFLFGLVMGATRIRAGKAWHITPARLVFGGSLLIVLLLSALALPVNRAGQLAARDLLAVVANPASANPAATANAIATSAEGSCRARWFEGLLRHAAGDPEGRTTAWTKLLICSGDHTGYMAVLAADDTDMARRAIVAQPDWPAGYFWLAPILAAELPDEAIALYRQGLALAPDEGRYWLALGDLLMTRDETAALDAFLQACLNGDPGANGCLRAGSLAEARGDGPLAVEYYRLSKWGEAQARADELERQLAAGQP